MFVELKPSGDPITVAHHILRGYSFFQFYFVYLRQLLPDTQICANGCEIRVLEHHLFENIIID